MDRIVWDERKRLANIVKHSLDFADLDLAFFASATIFPTRNRRFMAVGLHIGGILVVVFAKLGAEGLSIISMRPAGRRERALLDEQG